MDIHKPKPWHGLREFLKEIGTIVIGVLIALGAEAVVENLHEARLSEEARAAIRDEISVDLANMKRREDLEPCIARRLSELSDYVSRTEAGEAVPPPLTIGAPGHPTTTSERWEATRAGGRASLLSVGELRRFARVEIQLKGMQDMKPVEREVWGDLIGLEGVRHPSPELLARARGAIGRARLLDNQLRTMFYEAEGSAARIGVKGDPTLLGDLQSYRDQPICQPLSTPADVAARLAGPRPISP